MDSSGQPSFADIAEFIEDAAIFAVCGHVNPDGDSIGSVLGMTAALRQAGKTVTPLMADGATAPHRFAYLQGYADFVRASDYTDVPDVLIQLDTANIERMGEAETLLQRCAKSVSIDHHPGGGIGADMSHIDPDSPSASMLVWELTKAMIGQPDPFVAMACYTGLLTDTGRFQFQNTNPRAFVAASEMVEAGADISLAATELFMNKSLDVLRLESRVVSRICLTPSSRFAYSWILQRDNEELDVSYQDAEGLVDVVRSVEGIDAALLMRERPDGMRCSIRAKRDMDVSRIARQYGGGGHKAAAGFTIEGKTQEKIGWMVEQLTQIEQELDEQDAFKGAVVEARL